MRNDRPSIESAVQSLLSVNMGLKENERLLILGDTAGDGGELAREVGDVARSLHQKTETLIFDPVGGHGQEPPRHVWEAALGGEAVDGLDKRDFLEPILLKKTSQEDLRAALDLVGERPETGADVIIAITRFSTSHTSFRKLLTAAQKKRFARMPLFERDMFFGPMDIDWVSMAGFTRTLGRSLEGADYCEISSPTGTNLVLGVSARPVVVDAGILTEPGSFGNLPAGEVFIAPVEGTAEGTLVLEWGPLDRFKSPLKVGIREGRVVSVDGDTREDVHWLKDALAAHPDNSNVAELGIGTNPKAARPDNVLESEKILGTVHVAFGDNHTFGGHTVAPYHQDFVVFDATLVAVWETGGGRRVLLSNGKPGW
jgi:aminopeptidase